MAIDTKPNFSSNKFEQCSGDIMNLSGCTQIYGLFDIETGATLTICNNAGDGKILTSNSTGIASWQDAAVGGITSISGGSGMNFSPITTTGEIILGTPSAILSTSTDVSSGNTHNHAFSASTFVTGTQGILVSGNTNQFYLDDTYIANAVLPNLHTVTGVDVNQSLGDLPSGQTLGMVYITNNGSAQAIVDLGTTTTGNDITPYESIVVDPDEDVSITVNMRLSTTETKAIYINSLDWTNVDLNVQWAHISYDNVPLPTGGTGGLSTASNGLTALGSDVKLGGTLSETTTLSWGSNGSYFSMYPANNEFDLFVSDGSNFNNIYSNLSANYLSNYTYTDTNNNVESKTYADAYCLEMVITGTSYTYNFNETGLYSNNDFSNSYTDNHFVQKSYVDSLTGGTSYTFSDGLTETSGTVKLGGDYAAGMWFYPTAVAGSAYFGLCNDGTIDQYAENVGNETWLNMTQSVGVNPAMCIETGVATTGACYASRFYLHKDCIRFFGCTDNRLNAEIRYDENGFKYTTDVSSQWTGATADRYLVDKGYVDSMSGGSSSFWESTDASSVGLCSPYNTIAGVSNITGGSLNIRTTDSLIICNPFEGGVSINGISYDAGGMHSYSGQLTIGQNDSGETLRLVSSGDICIDLASATHNLFIPNITGCTNSDVLYYDSSTAVVSYGAAPSGGTGSPAGSDTYIQFNDNGSFGANIKLSFDDSNNAFTAGWRCGTVGSYSTVLGGGNAGENDAPNTASGYTSYAHGLCTQALDCASTAWGEETISNGYLSTVWGYQTNSLGFNSTAFGRETLANCNNTTAFGRGTIASGDTATAWGCVTNAGEIGATAWGCGTTVKGGFATAFGLSTTANDYVETVLGRYNVIGTGNIGIWIAADNLFTIGNGSFGAESNALQIKKSGNLYLPNISGCTASDVLYYDSADGSVSYGTAPTGGTGGSPGGTDGSIQFNNGGTFSGTCLIWDDSVNHIGWGTAAEANNMFTIKSDTAYDTPNTIMEVYLPDFDTTSRSAFKISKDCVNGLGTTVYTNCVNGYANSVDATLLLNTNSGCEVNAAGVSLQDTTVSTGGDLNLAGASTSRVRVYPRLNLCSLAGTPTSIEGDMMRFSGHSSCPDGLYYNNGTTLVQLDASGGTAVTPGGTNGQIQYNDGGAFGGTGLEFDDSVNTFKWGTSAASALTHFTINSFGDSYNDADYFNLKDCNGSYDIIRLSAQAGEYGVMAIDQIHGMKWGSPSGLCLSASTRVLVDNRFSIQSQASLPSSGNVLGDMVRLSTDNNGIYAYLQNSWHDVIGKKDVSVTVFASTEDVVTGDGTIPVFIPESMDKHYLYDVIVGTTTPSTGGTTTDVQIRRLRSGTGNDMLSTKVTLAVSEYFVSDGVINGAYAGVNTGDVIFVDVDAAGDGSKGLYVTLTFSY